MRVFSAVSSLFLAFRVATANQLDARALVPSVDTCAFVKTDVFTLLDLPDVTGAGKLNVCLCLSTLRPFVQANAVTSVAADLLGEDAVYNALLSLVVGKGKQCTYPVHAVPMCQQGDPCGFGCTDGYTLSNNGKKCVCPAPKIECNGQCQTQACSSALPQSPNKRGISGAQARTRMRILTEERCPRGYVLCGASHSRRRHAEEWECIDTRKTLDSCGGCMFPFLLDQNPVTGVDCTSLSGVSGVQCHAGHCLIHRCKRGFSLDPSRSECLRDITGPNNSTL